MIKILLSITLFLLFSCNSNESQKEESSSTSSPVTAVKRELNEGILQKDFGSTKSGYSVFDIAGSHDDGLDHIVNEQGEIFIVGYARNPEYDIVLWKIRADGSLDTSFADSQGYALLDDPTGTANGNGHDFGRAIAFSQDGAILIGGQTYNGSNYDLVIAKYNLSGQLDKTFGSNGVYTQSISPTSNDDLKDIKVIADGSILITGYSNSSGSDDMLLMKLTSNGALDLTFKTKGYALYDSSSSEKGYTLEIDSGGNFYIGGIASSKPTIWKVKNNGDLDNSFGFGGIESFTSKNGDIRDIVLDKDGAILAVGHILESQAVRYDMALWKFKTSGDIDITFGDDHDNNGVLDGYVHHHSAGGTSNGEDFANAVVVDDYGNIIICGHSESSLSHDPDMAIWRYSKDGQLDTSFGGDRNPADGNPDGFVLHHNAGGHDQTDQCRSLILDSEGKLLAVGFSVSPTQGSQMVFWKLD